MKKTMIVIASLLMVAIGMGGTGGCSKENGPTQSSDQSPTPTPDQTQTGGGAEDRVGANGAVSGTEGTIINEEISTEVSGVAVDATSSGAVADEATAAEAVAGSDSQSSSGGSGETSTETAAGGGETEWHSPVSVCLGTSAAGQSQITVAANGSATVVCREASSLYARRYSAEGVWDSDAVLLDSLLSIVNTPQVAMDPLGNAMAVWSQHDGTTFKIFSASYNVLSNSWGAPVVIDAPSTLPASNPMIAAGSDGSFMAVWLRSPASLEPVALFASRILPGESWDTAVRISSGGGGAYVRTPDIAVGSDGSAFAIWALVNDIYINRFVLGTWGEASLIESGSDPARDPQIAAGPEGRAFATWIQKGSVGPTVGISGDTVHVRQFDPALSGYIPPGWVPSERPVTNNPWYVPLAPHIAIDALGNATVVWSQSSYVEEISGPTSSILSSRRPSGGSWSDASLVEQSNTPSNSPQLAVDQDGNVFVVWRRGNDIAVNIFNVASGVWGTESTIDQLSSPASEPKIAVLPNGRAVAIWVQRDGTFNKIFASVYN